MDRRGFLKLAAVSPLAGLAAKESKAQPSHDLTIATRQMFKEGPTVAEIREFIKENPFPEADTIEVAVGFAMEDTPKGSYGWVQLAGPQNSQEFMRMMLKLT